MPDAEARFYPSKGVHGRIVEHLARRILSGEMAPASLLPRESELAYQLGTSRTAVREAVKVLAAKGLVETRQRRGTAVRAANSWNLLDPDVLAWRMAETPDPDVTRQLVELRRLIEPPAARLAAQRRTAAQMAAIDAALGRMREHEGKAEGYYDADLAFHRALFAACGNSFLDLLGAAVTAVLEVSFHLQQRSLIPHAVGLAMHERVAAGIRAGDAAAAEAAMHDIIAEAEIELERAFRAGDDA
ncbi:MAG: FadR/GntR family transcriptional regulator [Geminicoccaceae bacterium]